MATNEELQAQIDELMQWKAEKEAQQISFPLDKESFEVLNKYFLSIIDDYVYFAGANSNPFRNLVGSQDGKLVDLGYTMFRYTVDPATDYVYIVDQSPFNKFVDDETVGIFTTDTEPAGLNGVGGLTTLYVVSASSDGYSFKLSTTSGGGAINITSKGSGKQFLIRTS